MSRGRLRVGCSGWVYRDWRGTVYAPELPRRDWFADYAKRFDTVELNATFYRLPTTTAVERWAAQAPAGFVYHNVVCIACRRAVPLKKAS